MLSLCQHLKVQSTKCVIKCDEFSIKGKHRSMSYNSIMRSCHFTPTTIQVVSFIPPVGSKWNIITQRCNIKQNIWQNLHTVSVQWQGLNWRLECIALNMATVPETAEQDPQKTKKNIKPFSRFMFYHSICNVLLCSLEQAMGRLVVGWLVLIFQNGWSIRVDDTNSIRFWVWD